MFETFIHWTTFALEAAGIAVMALGTLFASLAALARAARGTIGSALYEWYRQTLARAILLGLEFLVAADIINTVAVDPSFRSVGVLGMIVLVRTFLSFTLELEISGRWPWQARPGHDAPPAAASAAATTAATGAGLRSP